MNVTWKAKLIVISRSDTNHGVMRFGDSPKSCKICAHISKNADSQRAPNRARRRVRLA
jgi:hypothetical protein